jgi:hypothetical protein
LLENLLKTCNFARGRCYDGNFLRFLTFFDEKNGVFLKNQCYDQIFLLALFFSQKRQFFRRIFHNIGPRIEPMNPDILSSGGDGVARPGRPPSG